MNPKSTARSRQVPFEPIAAVPILPTKVVSLSNGHYSVRLSGVGSGYSDCRGVAITRWMPDEIRDSDGFHIYLHDLDDDLVWSAGFQPTRVAALEYQFQHHGNVAEIRRIDNGVECLLAVCVSPHDDFEVRCCHLTNLDDRVRRIEVTSYLEWVLGSREADASHPAFSKLFVETQFDRSQGAILARRRPRHSDDAEFWGFHSMACDAARGSRADIAFETNRARFLGRGRSLRRPQALEPGSVLAGESGPVLDPIASLRTAVSLEPGESRRIAFVLGGSRSRSHVDAMLDSVGTFAQLERQFELAGSAAERDANGSAARDGAFTAEGTRTLVHPPHRISGWNPTEGLPERRFTPAIASGLTGEAAAADMSAPLQFENDYGGFSADGREYVIRLQPDGRNGHKRPPLPWVNVISNEQAGFLVTESGAGYTWSGNSRTNRLTAWHNDPVSDPHSEALWIRDEDAGVFWSPLPGPTPAAAEYRIHHGFGYTIFRHESFQISQEVTMFVARDEPVKLSRLRLVNRSSRPRRLSIFSYLHWALGAENCNDVATSCDANERVIWARNPNREHYGTCVAFSALSSENDAGEGDVSFSCDRASFLGRYGDLDAPEALVRGDGLDGRVADGSDTCAAWHVRVNLAPGETFECTYLLGEAANEDEALSLVRKFRAAGRVDRELSDVKAFWQENLSAIAIETPNREIDLMVNGWLVYQNMSCRLWGRSAFYQPGGAFGFRDQLQDSAALVYQRPDLTRAQILRHAAQQFVEGDVLHWWHPDTGYGLRTRFSDDLLWLPYVTAEYVQTTGDAAVLDEELPFLTAAPLVEGQQEAYLCPTPSGLQGTLYEHCCRALDRGLTTGQNGLPLIGCGDWNDGFSRIGRQGCGESVWLGFFIDVILERMLPLCFQRGDRERVARYEAYRERLRGALNTAGWDGAWYRRAFYDHGTPIGSRTSDECQIDALAQAWAVLSKVAPADRAAKAIDAVESRLIDDEAGIIRLLTPAFDRTPHDPGYIKGYLPGIRENGGQYTHGVLWVVRAMAELGRGTRAVELLRLLTPVWHTATSERVEVYRTEPYVVAADVYGEPPHVGRGGWTWYTGSAGWMFRVAVESILGLSMEQGQRLIINPCISSAWPQCRLTYRLPGDRTSYEITIANPNGKERGVTSGTLDGRQLAVEKGRAIVPLERDGRIHRVSVQL